MITMMSTIKRFPVMMIMGSRHLLKRKRKRKRQQRVSVEILPYTLIITLIDSIQLYYIEPAFDEAEVKAIV